MTHSVDLAGEEGGHVVQVVVDAPHLEGSGLAIAPVVWIKKWGNLFFWIFSLIFDFSGVDFFNKVLPLPLKRSQFASELTTTNKTWSFLVVS